MLESVDVGRQSIGDYEVTAGREVIERLRSLAEPLRGALAPECNSLRGRRGRDTAFRGAPDEGLGHRLRLEDHYRR